jgi:hypothetical protein
VVRVLRKPVTDDTDLDDDNAANDAPETKKEERFLGA